MQNAKPVELKILFGFWIVICAVFAARTLFTGASMPLLADSDDAMRMVVVLDLLNGQGWYDHIQLRLNTPYGADIHWSRLIDAPIAALVGIMQPFFGQNAFVAAAWIWPLLLLLALLYFSVRITTFLVGPDGLLPGLVLPILSAAILVEFAPGRVDHHNVQIVLTLALLYACMRSWRSPNWALVAGVVAATSIAIGMEALPQIIVAVSVFGLFYVVDGQRGKTARAFGLSFGLAALVNLLIYLPPQNWFPAVCDALSPVYLFAAMGVAAVFVIFSFAPLRFWFARLALGVVLGGALVAGVLILFPHCASGPYGAIDPWLVERWLSKIVEAKPVWHSFAAIPSYTLGIIIPPIIAFVVLAGFILRAEKDQRAEWLILGLFLLAGILVVLAQVRGARLVAGMVAPIGAWTILYVRQRYLAKQSLLNIFALVLSWLVYSGLVIAVAAGYVLPKIGGEVLNTNIENSEPQQVSKFACLQPDVFVDLASLPPERIMAPVDLGAHILLFTPHSVVGAPYHRNQAGLMDSFRFFNLPLDQAKEILAQREISLIVTCPYLPEMAGFADAAEDSFVRTVTSGYLPDWLQDFTLPGSFLNVYGVVD